MKTINKIALVMLALGASAYFASAQDAGGPPPEGGNPPNQDGPGGPGGPGGGGRGRHRPPPPLIIGALDANHDGIIDSNEIANASAALLKLDKNGDGQLTAEEYLGPKPPGAPTDDKRKPPAPPVVKALDANGDGVIDAGEIANASAALLKLDKNGDGQLTREELRPPRPPRGEGPGDGAEMGPPPDGAPAGDNAPPGPPPDNQ
jgi:hypothetical protein